MRASVLTASLLLAATPALAVQLPADPKPAAKPAPKAASAKPGMTQLPEDWLDDDPAGAPAEARAETQEASIEGSAAGEARRPVPGVDCDKSSGTTGAILGAVAGGLLGNVIDGGRHRAAGTLLGAGGGALLGREVERNGTKCK